MTSILLASFLIALQTAAGAVLWMLIRPNASLVERLGMGIAMGSGISALSGVILFPFISLLFAVSLPLLLVLFAAIVFRLMSFSARAIQIPTRSGSTASTLFAIAIGLGLGFIALVINWRNYPLEWSETLNTYHGDFLFFEALSTSLGTLGPHDSIFMAGAELRYHWMAYAWIGQIAELAQTDSFFGLIRVLPVTSLIAVILLAVAWTQRLTRNPWAPSLAVVLLISGGYVGASYGTILNFDSPSQQLATVWMLASAMALWQLTQSGPGQRVSFLWRSPRSWLLVVAIAILSAVTMTGKASSGLIVLAGWAFTVVIGLYRRATWSRTALIGLVAASAGSAAATFAYVSGSAGAGGLGVGGLLDKASSVQGLNPVSSPPGIVAGTFILMLAVSYRWAGLVWLVRKPETRWEPVTLFGVGIAIAGLVALAIFSAGINDTWFPLAASAPLAVISAVGLVKAATRITARKRLLPAPPIIGAFTIGVGTSILVLWLWTFAPGTSLNLRWSGPLVALAIAVLTGLVLASRPSLSGLQADRVVALVLIVLVASSMFGRGMGIFADRFGVQPAQGIQDSEFRPYRDFVNSQDRQMVTSWTQNHVAAGTWIRENIRPGALVASNVTFSPLVAALTSAPTFVTGINYQAPYGRPSIQPALLEREATSWAFAARSSEEAAQQLCLSNVQFIWLDKSRPIAEDWTPWATVVLNIDEVMLLELDETACDR